MRDRTANIVITYGSKAYKFLWIKQTARGLYYGFYNKAMDDFHMSYHSDGRRHFVKDGQKKQIFYTVPLSDIKSIYNLITICPGAFETQDKLSIPYTNEAMHNIIWVDMRCFPDNATVNIHIYLVRPENISDLSSGWFKKKEKDDYHLIQIINAFEPWLVVHARGVKT